MSNISTKKCVKISEDRFSIQRLNEKKKFSILILSFFTNITVKNVTGGKKIFVAEKSSNQIPLILLQTVGMLKIAAKYV